MEMVPLTGIVRPTTVMAGAKSRSNSADARLRDVTKHGPFYCPYYLKVHYPIPTIEPVAQWSSLQPLELLKKST
jgi:hypothetical protein